MPDPSPLHGKATIITGASAGIGRATALAFAAKGANLILTARREQRLADLCAEIAATGSAAVFYGGDASDPATAQACVALALERFSRLDILINNAGAGNYRNLVDTSVEEYDHLMRTNMRSGFLFSRFAAPVMIEQRSGEIMFVSSIAGLQGYAGEAAYCASKFAQVGFAQALDAELRPHGIKVGTICPGGVKTEFAIGVGRTEQYVRDSWMMEPSEVADAIVFACSQPPNARILQLTIRHIGQRVG